jgi:hypothetical protein
MLGDIQYSDAAAPPGARSESQRRQEKGPRAKGDPVRAASC